MSNNENNARSNEIDKENVSNNLKYCMYGLFILAFFRIFALQFFWIFSDLMGTLIIYCTYTNRGKLVSIFCLINGVMGIIYAIAIGSLDIKKFNTEKDPILPINSLNNSNNSFN